MHECKTVDLARGSAITRVRPGVFDLSAIPALTARRSVASDFFNQDPADSLANLALSRVLAAAAHSLRAGAAAGTDPPVPAAALPGCQAAANIHANDERDALADEE